MKGKKKVSSIPSIKKGNKKVNEEDVVIGNKGHKMHICEYMAL
jgi:hypothetical protein